MGHNVFAKVFEDGGYLPAFLVAMFIAVAGMPTNVVDVHRSGMGIEPAQPWRSTSMAFTVRVKRWLERLRTAIQSPFAIPAAAVLILALAVAVTPMPAEGASLAVVAAIPNMKQLKQDKADLEASEKNLKAEGRRLTGIAAADRTPEQVARIKAIDTELDALA